MGSRPEQPRGLQDVEGAQGIHLKIVAGILHRGGHRHLGSQVIDDVHVGRGLAQRLKVPDVGLEQRPGVAHARRAARRRSCPSPARDRLS